MHFAALYATTGLVLAPPPEGVYLSGPAFYVRGDTSITDTLRMCTDDSFPVCPDTFGPLGLPSNCPCTDRSKIVIGGVVHGVTTDEFWDMVFAAAEQGADDMGVKLRFDRFEPQESNEILYRKMSAKILSLCQGGVDGLFVSLSDPIILDAVKICQELKVPVMSINAGVAESEDMGLIHHVGMIEENAGFLAGKKMASMASFSKAFCLNYETELAVIGQRCNGFEKAMGDLGIEYGEVSVPNDNIARFKALVETAVDDRGDWNGYAFLVTGQPQIPAALELKKDHPGFVMGSFDTSNLLTEAIGSGDVLFGIDQQPYLQGYYPVPILTHAATTKQFFLNHAVESGPSFITSSPSSELSNCIEGLFPVCPEHPQESFNYVNDALIILGIVFFALQAVTSSVFLGWMVHFRTNVIVKASQPEFLSLVAFGCLMQTESSINAPVEGGMIVHIK